MRENRIRRICFFIASLVESVALDNPKRKKKMLKKVWSYTVDFCIRFRTIRDNPTYILRYVCRYVSYVKLTA